LRLLRLLRILTLKHYEKIGGLANALSQHSDEALVPNLFWFQSVLVPYLRVVGVHCYFAFGPINYFKCEFNQRQS